ISPVLLRSGGPRGEMNAAIGDHDGPVGRGAEDTVAIASAVADMAEGIVGAACLQIDEAGRPDRNISVAVAAATQSSVSDKGVGAAEIPAKERNGSGLFVKACSTDADGARFRTTDTSSAMADLGVGVETAATLERHRARGAEGDGDIG